MSHWKLPKLAITKAYLYSDTDDFAQADQDQNETVWSVIWTFLHKLQTSDSNDFETFSDLMNLNSFKLLSKIT